MLQRRLHPRPIIAQIIGIRAIHDRSHAELRQQRFKLCIKLRLAVITPVGCILEIIRPRQLIRRNHDMPNSNRPRQLLRRFELPFG